MEYTVVFDVNQSGYRHWWFPALGLVFVFIASILFRFRHQLGTRTPKSFPYVCLGIAIFVTVVAFAGTAGNYLSLASALREGRCEVVTGEVTQFRCLPPDADRLQSDLLSAVVSSSIPTTSLVPDSTTRVSTVARYARVYQFVFITSATTLRGWRSPSEHATKVA
jgi:hypothetical protein